MEIFAILWALLFLTLGYFILRWIFESAENFSTAVFVIAMLVGLVAWYFGVEFDFEFTVLHFIGAVLVVIIFMIGVMPAERNKEE